MSSASLYQTFKNHDHGPRHPVSAALMCLAALIDGRVLTAVGTKLDDDKFVFGTSVGYEITVKYYNDPKLGEFCCVETVTTPEGVEVPLTFHKGELSELFLSELKNTPGALPS